MGGSKPAESEKGKENEPTAEKIETQSSPTKDDVAEKIKSRAERFGGFQSDDAKKAARAAKFGDMLGKQQGGGKITSAGTEVDVDLLKKRADRFGTATSTALKKAEVSEAIKRRQERFGVITADEPKPKKVTLNAGINSVVMDEKMKARMVLLESALLHLLMATVSPFWRSHKLHDSCICVVHVLLDIVREKSTGRFYIAGFDALIRVKQTKLQKLYLEIFQVSTY